MNVVKFGELFKMTTPSQAFTDSTVVRWLFVARQVIKAKGFLDNRNNR